MQNVAPRLSETPGHVEWVGPELGQHNEEIYGELLGMDSRAMSDLQERGII
jgi:crotonobetainyl-CoA:carnitine CoA-transferase CaiB-like acyl-CoA transferase